jgi:hypothetical protein
MWRGPIRVRRDKNDDPIFQNQNVQDFGCVVIKPDPNGKLPAMLAVAGGATYKDCAQFEITTEKGKYQFKELYVVCFFSRHSFILILV